MVKGWGSQEIIVQLKRTITHAGMREAKGHRPISYLTPPEHIKGKDFAGVCQHQLQEVQDNIHYPVKESSRTNKTRFCCFHKRHWHNIYEFVHLKDVIDKLI